MNNAVKSFDILAISLNILHNYFDNPTKSSSDLVSFLDSSAKPFSFRERMKVIGFRCFSQVLNISTNCSI